MTFPIIPPNRTDMKTLDGASFSPRVKQYLEDLSLVVAELKTATDDTEIVEIELIQSVLLEALGLHSDPLSLQALGQISHLQAQSDSMEQQIAELQAAVNQLRAQAMNQDATLEAILDADEMLPLVARLSNVEKGIREVFENAEAFRTG